MIDIIGDPGGSSSIPITITSGAGPVVIPPDIRWPRLRKLTTGPHRAFFNSAPACLIRNVGANTQLLEHRFRRYRLGLQNFGSLQSGYEFYCLNLLTPVWRTATPATFGTLQRRRRPPACSRPGTGRLTRAWQTRPIQRGCKLGSANLGSKLGNSNVGFGNIGNANGGANIGDFNVRIANTGPANGGAVNIGKKYRQFKYRCRQHR